MNTNDENRSTTDEFEPVELGSVSAETRGEPEGDTEAFPLQSREQ